MVFRHHKREKGTKKKRKKEKTLRVSADEYFFPFKSPSKVKCKEEKSAGWLGDRHKNTGAFII